MIIVVCIHIGQFFASLAGLPGQASELAPRNTANHGPYASDYKERLQSSLKKDGKETARIRAKAVPDRWGQHANPKAIDSISLAMKHGRPITDTLGVASCSLAAPPATNIVNLP